MDKLVQQIEKMDEMAYILDFDSGDIIYINKKLRERLGYSSHDDYNGKKCYEIICRYFDPCSFCSIEGIKRGESSSQINMAGNRRVLHRESILEYKGKQYRLGFVLETTVPTEKRQDDYQARSENIINECLRYVASTVNPEESISQILDHVGSVFFCDRVYVFEFRDTVMDNTYEWCSHGVSVQKNILQNMEKKDIGEWITRFQNNNEVIIEDLEKIRKENPLIYAVLKPQGVGRLVVVPIFAEDKLIGFWGVDNPGQDAIKIIVSILKTVSCFIVFLLRHRDLLNRMKRMKDMDTVTGALNRNAMFRHFTQIANLNSLGIVYCDIVDLKENNAARGSSAGDQLLRERCAMICRELKGSIVYRVGGDEFSAVFVNISEAEFMKKVKEFQKHIERKNLGIEVGYAWSDEKPVNLDDVLLQADKVLRDKLSGECMYDRINMPEEKDEKWRVSEELLLKKDSMFYRFLKSSCCDLEMVFRSISQNNTSSYFYFGDLQKNLFYISDNLRDEFGFQSNIVPKFLTAWENRIASEKWKNLYRNTHETMFREKSNVHDLCYRVRDIRGKSMWVHCYGILEWNKDKTVPMFFSGRITHQDYEFEIDSVTGFPRTSVMLQRLNQMKIDGRKISTIGFSINNITEINNTKGRACGDHLLRGIAEELVNRLSSKISFYRLDGIRCMAVLEPSCRDSAGKLVGEIREVISKWYGMMGIPVQKTCSFAVMDYCSSDIAPEGFLEQMVSLIKVAKHDSESDFVEYSGDNINKVKRMAEVSLALSRDVMQGMEHFRIMIQPMVSVDNEKIIGGEVLLRWEFEGRDVPPSIFIPILEKSKMIYRVGRWVFEQAVCACMRMLAHQPKFYLTFNVSMYQMSDAGLTDFMRETLSKYHMDGIHLIAEITENSMDGQPEEISAFVEQCGQMGIQIALDDFGNGYSSLRRLLQYQFSIIKLDRTIICEMMESEEKKNFMFSVVYACHRFGKKVCMEGVETREQNSIIEEAGCDIVQGYYYYRPLELEQMYRLLSLS